MSDGRLRRSCSYCLFAGNNNRCANTSRSSDATRAEIIGGLKKQGFLIAQGKHIVPTEAGLSLFGVLKQADPALVDPGVTAQLECLLDDVVVGKQEMVGAIDAVCSVAERIIGKLKEGAAAGGPSLLGAAVGNGPGT
jgi:DNA topoisomerase III